jgi:photosystem II stability/assembly factor-like uncharacterized protein
MRWIALLGLLVACSGSPASQKRDPCIASGTCPPGTWVNVTPADMMIPQFGPGPIVVDPVRPSDLYLAGGGDGVWKSTDYGNTWTQINADIGYVPMGLVIAVAPSTPATVYISAYKMIYKSLDGGVTYSTIPNDLPAELYSIAVDPSDATHLVSGLHEADGIVESTDAGQTWKLVGGADFPTGGISWYPFFRGASNHWLAIAQDGGSVVTTDDGGAHWTIPAGISGLTHAHGNAQIFQHGSSIWVPGTGGPGDGLYRSTDNGQSFDKVADGSLSVAWGSDQNVYAMWGWACAGCNLGASFQSAPLPDGSSFTKMDVPMDLVIGANHVAVTSDGTHTIFVGTMWSTGMWRYVEP